MISETLVSGSGLRLKKILLFKSIVMFFVYPDPNKCNECETQLFTMEMTGGGYTAGAGADIVVVYAVSELMGKSYKGLLTEFGH